MISSELPEVLRVADRILVMREGRLVAEFDHADASEETIVAAATGQIEELALPREHDAGPAAGAGRRRAGVGARRLVDLVFRIRESGIIAALGLLVLSRRHPAAVPQLSELRSSSMTRRSSRCSRSARRWSFSRGTSTSRSARCSASRPTYRPDLFGHHPGIPIVVVFLAGLGIGVACGIANGLLVTIGHVPSLVVTLATLYIIRGIDTLIVGGGQVVASSLPNSFLNIQQATIAGFPTSRS